MKCWHCQTELIWGADHDIEDWKSEEYSMETNLSCPECASMVIVYMAVQPENDRYGNPG